MQDAGRKPCHSQVDVAGTNKSRQRGKPRAQAAVAAARLAPRSASAPFPYRRRRLKRSQWRCAGGLLNVLGRMSCWAAWLEVKQGCQNPIRKHSLYAAFMRE